MSHERVLRQRLRVLGTLHEAVGALRSLSAHHFRAARAALPRRARLPGRGGGHARRSCPRCCRRTGEDGGPPATRGHRRRPGSLRRLRRAARRARRWRPARRSAPVSSGASGGARVRPLARAGLTPDRVWAGAAGTAALPRLLVPLVDEIVTARRGGTDRRRSSSSRHASRARAASVRHASRVLPVRPAADAAPLRPTPYARPAHLAAVLVREFLYVALHETLARRARCRAREAAGGRRVGARLARGADAT